jgi:hypothetical protein
MIKKYDLSREECFNGEFGAIERYREGSVSEEGQL